MIILLQILKFRDINLGTFLLSLLNQSNIDIVIKRITDQKYIVMNETYFY